MDAQIGREMEILFEELKPDGKVFGRSNNFFNLLVKGSEELLGTTRKVRVTASDKGSLEGEVVA